MAVLQMQRMSICALKKDRKAILEKIQSMGVMEINHVLDEDEDFRRMDTANARSSFEKAANSADRALEILNEYAPVKTSMLSSLEGKKLVDAKVHEEVIRKREELLKVVSQIQALDKEKAENKAEILKEVVNGPVTPKVPGSILQFHPHVTVICDEEAAKYL